MDVNRVVRSALVGIVICVLPSAAKLNAQQGTQSAGKVGVLPGFFSGREYKALKESAQVMYLAGYYDGLLASPFLGAAEARVVDFGSCIPGLNLQQFKAIVDKFLSENPSRWGEAMDVLIWASLPEACHSDSGEWKRVK